MRHQITTVNESLLLEAFQKILETTYSCMSRAFLRLLGLHPLACSVVGIDALRRPLAASRLFSFFGRGRWDEDPHNAQCIATTHCEKFHERAKIVCSSRR